ncbi:PfkB family carbohydrate kinase [Corticibacter populi]|nr:PfkB family carbohydrate kinase [Corticibacter populi]RZS33286.1 ribokinase [Corticibacter populi]
MPASAPRTPPAPRMLIIGSFVQAHCWYMDRLPHSDESQLASRFAQEAGGKGLAVAIGCHRLGTQVALALAVGADAAGRALVELLHAQGIGTGLVQSFDGHSGHGAGLIDAAGHTLISVHPGANARIAEVLSQPAAQRALRTASLVYAQLEVPAASVAQALQAAHRLGIATVLNPSPWQALPPALLAAAEILVVNRVEAGALLGGGPGECADTARLLAWLERRLPAFWADWPGRWLVVTLGEHGCRAYGRDGSRHAEAAHPVCQPQPIGAGDAFSAGLCHGLAAGLAMPHALALANACGALAASRAGILDALPQRHEVDHLLTPAT